MSCLPLLSQLVINAALGFDSFLVMRHGVRDEGSFEQGEGDVDVSKCQVRSIAEAWIFGCVNLTS